MTSPVGTISRITEMRDQRSALYNKQRAALDTADLEKRDLTSDESADYDRRQTSIDKLDSEIERLERQASLKPNQALTTGLASEARTAGGETTGGWLQAAFERRDLTMASSATYTVPPRFETSIIDRLAETSVGLASGFTLINIENASVHIPRIAADGAAAWTAEAATITESDPTFAEIIATPRKLAAIVALSNEVLADSNPAVRGVVESNLIRAVALKLDLGFYEGSGTTPEIRGLKNVAGTQTVSLGANGATPTNLDPIADALGMLEQANASGTAIVMSPRTWKTLSKIKEIAGSAKPVMQESAGSTAQGIERRIYGVPVFLSSQISITETSGTSTDCSSIYVYQADQVLAVQRTGTEVVFDGSRLFNKDMSEIRAISRWDIVVPNPAAVVRVTGVRP